MLQIKLADSAGELEAVQRFRYTVYVDEMGKPMAEADHERKMVVDAADERGQVFAAYDDGELVGTLRLSVGLESMAQDPHLAIYDLGLFSTVDAGQLAFATRFMLRRDYRGSMAAHRLALAALEFAQATRVRLALIYCAPYLVSYYEQMGFRRYTNNFQDELGYRIPMVMVLFDREYLQAVKSPLLERIPPDPPGEDWHSWFAERFGDFVIPVNSRLVSTEEFYQLLNYKLHDDPLSSIPLLRGLAKEEADQVLKAGTVIQCRVGDTIIRAGEHSSEIYLNLSAMVGVRAPATERIISILGPGELLGEMAFLLGSTRTADVTVLKDGDLLVLSEKTLAQLIDKMPVIASKLMVNLARILAERLATTTRSLAEHVAIGPAPGGTAPVLADVTRA